jgi:hypothetical protein
MAQLVDCLPSQCKALSSNSSTAKKKKDTCFSLFIIHLILHSSCPTLQFTLSALPI